MKETKYIELEQEIITKVPELTEVISTHKKENKNEILPHILFEDIARYVVNRLEVQNDVNNSDFLKRTFELVEQIIISGDKEMYNVVAVSFLEYTFEPEKSYYIKAEKYFGSKTLELITHLQNARKQ